MLNLLILMIITFIITYIIIGGYLKKIRTMFAQPLLEEGPEHSQKMGTPTMGGACFILVYILIMTCLTIFTNVLGTNVNNQIIILLFLTTIGFYLIGLKDDIQKITSKKNSGGLSSAKKFFLQFIVATVIVILLYLMHQNTSITFYITSNKLMINLGLLYYVYIIVLFLATTNATNLTDGLDGLLTTNTIISLIFLTIIAFLNQNLTLVYSNVVLISVLLAFLMYNKSPAKIFMGDVGSLAIGGYLTIEAVLLKIEVLFLFFVFIYFIETLSVMLQVGYFKYTKKKTGEGKRIFLMAPLHHHLEKKNYTENKVVVIFSILNILFSLIGLIIYVY